MKKIIYLSVAALAGVAISALADTSSMTIPVTMVSTGPGSYQPAVNISVAGGPSTMVLLDTGSAGLHIFANQVGNMNITYTNHHVTNGYGDGEQFEGVVAYAPVTINGVATKPIPIVVVQKAYCAKNKPNCPRANQDPNNPQATGGMYGVMGIEMVPALDKKAPKQTLQSPLSQLPGNYATGFIAQGFNTGGGNLVIGLTPQNTANFNKVQLPKAGQLPDGTPYYDDKSLEVTYTIGNNTRKLKTAFDTGGNAQVHFFANGTLGFPKGKNNMVRPGESFEASLPNGFDWQFTTGKEPGVNKVIFKPQLGSKPPYMNTGITFYFYYDVMYDYANGMLGFSQH
jgi:hypothetical protein